MHIEVDISGSRIRYDAGDHVAIYPQNDTELVEKIGKLLELDLDTVFTMINLGSGQPKELHFFHP